MIGTKIKHTPRVVLRCLSCGAPIREGQEYHRLHIKGQPYYFCKCCVALSIYQAKKEDCKCK